LYNPIGCTKKADKTLVFYLLFFFAAWLWRRWSCPVPRNHFGRGGTDAGGIREAVGGRLEAGQRAAVLRHADDLCHGHQGERAAARHGGVAQKGARRDRKQGENPGDAATGRCGVGTAWLCEEARDQVWVDLRDEERTAAAPLQHMDGDEGAVRRGGGG